jgi:hypothetical protein
MRSPRRSYGEGVGYTLGVTCGLVKGLVKQSAGKGNVTHRSLRRSLKVERAA